MLRKCYFEQVLFSYPINTVDFEKVILCKSVTLHKCYLVVPSILLTLKKCYLEQANRANNSKSIEEFFRGVGENIRLQRFSD